MGRPKGSKDKHPRKKREQKVEAAQPQPVVEAKASQDSFSNPDPKDCMPLT